MASYTLTTASNYFKIDYGQLSENAFNSANVLLARIKREKNFVGKRLEIPTPTTFAGGVGSGSLPTANYNNPVMAQITAKKVYAVTTIDRETIKASESDRGAFAKMIKEPAKRAVESFSRNMSRILFNDATGALGNGDGATNVTGDGTTATPYIATIQAAGWNEANWEERDFVNYHTETTNLEVVEVVPSTRTIKLVGTSAGLAALAAGPSPVPTNRYFYMQGSKDNDPSGLKGVLDATSGTQYAVTVARRWQAQQIAAGGVGITTDLMNQLMLNVEKASGKVPNLIITSYVQLRKIMNQIEDLKRYPVEPRASNLKGKISFSGIEFMSTMGPVPVFAERFCDDDRLYALNDNHITLYTRPNGPEWFEDDGTVFLREASSDSYSARYGCYGEFYIEPPFHGVIDGLST